MTMGLITRSIFLLISPPFPKTVRILSQNLARSVVPQNIQFHNTHLHTWMVPI